MILLIIQLLHAVTGSMAFSTLERENETRGEAEGAFYPRGCTVTVTAWPQSQRATIVLLLPLYNCYSSSWSSVVIFKHYYDDPLFNKQTNNKQFPRTRGCFVHSVFVARHMFGSRPIKLHSFLPRYDHYIWKCWGFKICCNVLFPTFQIVSMAN